MLLELLKEHKQVILTRSQARIVDNVTLQLTDGDMVNGLPIFFDQLAKMLEMEEGPQQGEPSGIAEVAAGYGRDLLRLGFTLSQVVFSYGAICTVITALAEEVGTRIEARDFNILNRCLDVATAEAVQGFQDKRDVETARQEVEHLGRLAHELRNALGTSVIAFQQIKKGVVGGAGSTGAVLERSLSRMQNLIDRSIAEVRLRSGLPLEVKEVRVEDLFEEVAATARLEAERRGLTLSTKVDSGLVVQVDPQLLLSAVANLVQNAIKFSPRGGVFLHGLKQTNRVLLKVEDRCGGLTTPAEELFRPFSQAGADRTGLGLGLAIAYRSTKANRGDLYAVNLPGKGCTFVIDLPSRSCRP